MDAGTRADVDEHVGLAHHLLVMLDHNHAVAKIPEILEGLYQLVVVPLVEPDGWLVKNVHDADKPRPDLAREPYSLRLASGERLGGAREREVVEADVDQEAEALPDLLQDAGGDYPPLPWEVQAAEELVGLPY